MSASEARSSQYVEGVFSEVGDPLEAISSLQHDNRVRLPSMQPALPILDLHGISRAEIYGSMFLKLQERLLEKVDSLDTKGLTKLLDKCFRYIGSGELRTVCMKIMQKLPEIDEKYLLHVSEKRELYAACPIEVKRQVWQTNQGFFGEAVSPLLDQYIAEKESILFGTHGGSRKPVSFLSLLPKARRQSTIVQELVQMISTSLPLYKTLLQFLRTLFLRTQISHYCTLRADLLMSLHERESKICDSDHCYKFAWCLDACVRAGHVDGKKSRELYSFLEGISAGDEILGEVAMLLRDPYALNAICTSIVKCLLQLSEHSKLPRESSELECLLRLLQLGLKSLNIVDAKDYREDSLDVELMVRFFPELLSLMLDTSLHATCRQLKEDHTPYTPSQHFVTSLSNNPCAMHISCTYALHLLQKRDLRALGLLLPAIARGYTRSDSAQLPDVFLHLFVLNLTSQTELIREAALQPILRDFWLPCSRYSEPALLHFCRLLWTLHPCISRSTLEEVLEGMRPGEQLSAVAREQYQTLVEHIAAASQSD